VERLWAPWRLEYIERAPDDGRCIFCSPEEELLVHRGEAALVLLNKFPYASAHVMVAPVRHVGRYDELTDAEARATWPNRHLIQISESMTGRAIRTQDWTYCVADTSGSTKQSAAKTYTEYQMYDQRADPNELVNLAGRKEYRAKADELQAQLKKLLVAAGEPEPEIVTAKLYP